MNARLTKGQAVVLAAATLPMIGAGGLGAWGTFTNISVEFGRAATAAGVVAAGEGVVLVLALVMVGLTMLGQAAPRPVRAGLWGAPFAAAVMGVAVADTPTEAIVYAITPMAMSAAAEGLGLLARRIVVYRTGLDMEVQRRNADTMQLLAYHRARAANHPSKWARTRSERASWRLAKRVGLGDVELGAQLVEVQRERLRAGADAALADMLAVAPSVPELPAVEAVAELEQAPVEPRPVPEVVPAGARMLPLVARPVGPAEDDQPEQAPAEPEPRAEVVIPTYDMRVPDWTVPGDYWKGDPVLDPKPVVAASQDRQVVTEVVALTPNELLKRASKLNRDLVRSTNRPVTIDRLREEFGLSRREATDLRRLVVIPRGDERS